MGNKQNSGTDTKRPATKSIPQRTKSYLLKRIKKFWPEIIVIILFALSTGGVHFFWEPYDEVFLERDPRLSYPYIDDAHCRLPIPVIIFLAILVPILLGFTLQTIIRFWKRPEHIHPKAIDPFYGIVVMAQAYSINGLLSEFLKSYVGKKRPNFFAMCNYHGYRDAVATNNYTYYNSKTQTNRFGSMAYCWDQTTFINGQVRSSYPSGHASYSFCGYTILALLCIYVWHCHTRYYKGFKVLFFVLCELVALVLSWSRTLDYWHTHDDVYAGAVVGALVGTVVFILNYSFSTVDKLKKKLERAITMKKDDKSDKDTKGTPEHPITENKEGEDNTKKMGKDPQTEKDDKSDHYHDFNNV